MANIITVFRIILSMILLFYPALSEWFYIFYLASGFTDIIDGAIARRTKTVSEFGSKLDTIADFIFIFVCLIKILPVMNIPTWLLIWVTIIFLIKIFNILYGFIFYKIFMVEHTIMNKVTGFLLFLFPLTLSFLEMMYLAVIICIIATFAAIQEGHIIRVKKRGIN